MKDVMCKHISYNDIERYLSVNKKCFSQDYFAFLEAFDAKLDNCPICAKRYRRYEILSYTINEELHYENPIPDDDLQMDPAYHPLGKANEIISTIKNKIAEAIDIAFSPPILVPIVLGTGEEEETLPEGITNIDEYGIPGKLHFKVIKKDGTAHLKFYFKFDKYPDKPPYPPFYLTVHYITQSDENQHTAKLNIVEANSKEYKELIIASRPEKDIHYEGSFKIIGVDKNNVTGSV